MMLINIVALVAGAGAGASAAPAPAAAPSWEDDLTINTRLAFQGQPL